MTRSKAPTVPGLAPAYATRLGRAYAGDALEAIARMPAASVNLAFTSPPFALRRPKAYGNVAAAAYADWFLPIAEQVHRVLRDDGSFVVELGGAWNPGSGTRSLMPYALLLRLGERFHLAQDFYWWNTCRLPTPTQWVCRRRTRVKEAVTMIWWLSKTAEPKADNRRVLKPYERDVRHFKKRLRPSGHVLGPDTWQRDNGGAIPPNVFCLANTNANDDFVRRCKAAGAVVHPCRMPPAIPDFFVRFLTEPGDVVLDPFAGSNTTGAAAEALGRHWLAVEIEPDYVAASGLRFPGARAAGPGEVG